MEVKADLRPILGPNIVRLDPMRVKQLQHKGLYKAIDDLARLSAQAMQVRQPLTSCEKLINSENTVYLAWEFDEERNVSVLIGFCKVGNKKLFLYDVDQQTYEGEVLCLLDFYVHYSYQRKGHGRAIFDYMMHNEHVEPHQIALDNPTVTLLGFVGQKYGLVKPNWQNTNFVVFPELFAGIAPPSKDDQDAPAPEGWSRPMTPRRLGSGATGTRWLAQAVSGHPSKGGAMAAPVEPDHTTGGTLANRAHQAKCRKAHILSSNPLW